MIASLGQRQLESREAHPLPPLERGWPLLGSAVPMLRDPIGFMERCVEKHGRVHRIRLGPIEMTILHGAEAIDHVLLSNGKNYLKADIAKKAVAPLLGSLSVSTLTDPLEWKAARLAIRPAFVGGLLRQYNDHMVESIQRDTSRLIERAGGNATIDVYREIHEMVFRILIGTIFSRGIGEDKIEWLAERFDTMKGWINIRFMSLATLDWIPTPEIHRGKVAMRELDLFVNELINERRREGSRSERGDILDILLTARGLDGRPLDNRSIRDQVMTLLFGGHETTAGSIVWTLALLAKNPKSHTKLMAEVDRLEGRAPGYSDVGNLDYVRMCFEEAMRLYPMWLVLFRQAIADDVVEGFQIPGGSLVAFCGYTTHRDPAHWKDPESFDPQRFQKGARFERHRGSWIPFSLGERACIAARMATHQALLVISILSQRLTFELDGPLPEPQVRMSIRPRDGKLLMRLVARDPT